MHWLAEQGLAQKMVFLVIIPLLIFILTEHIKIVLISEEDERMNNKYNTIEVLNVSLNVISNLSGNMAGGALLTNAFYGCWICWDEIWII